MSLTTNTPLQSTRRKFFMISTYMMCRYWIQPFLGSGGKNESNSQYPVESARRKFFMNYTYIMSTK